ncbi:hypothetical protein PMAG_a0723 [Pseudoalteromonas mariniglutinosa NCIMB 1770]|nr:hypothetical protein [Pseudoalteromonas mariniglutinosa NCIMB 1770]
MLLSLNKLQLSCAIGYMTLTLLVSHAIKYNLDNRVKF